MADGFNTTFAPGGASMGASQPAADSKLPPFLNNRPPTPPERSHEPAHENPGGDEVVPPPPPATATAPSAPSAPAPAPVAEPRDANPVSSSFLSAVPGGTSFPTHNQNGPPSNLDSSDSLNPPVPAGFPSVSGATKPLDNSIPDNLEKPLGNGDHKVVEPVKAPEPTPNMEGAGPAVAAPKPVEVMSVPETPVDSSTPAGGTPRPLLNLGVEDVAGKPSVEPTAASGFKEPASTPRSSALDVPMAASESNGISTHDANNASSSSSDAPPAPIATSMPDATPVTESTVGDALVGEKRKLDDPAAEVGAGVPSAESSSDVSKPLDKKPKLDDDVSPAVANGSTPAVEDGSKKTPAKKEIKEKKITAPPPAVGITRRKTRSQGPAPEQAL